MPDDQAARDRAPAALRELALVYACVAAVTLLVGYTSSGLTRDYGHLLLALIPLTLILPSATTRTGILVHVYDQALEIGRVPRGAPLSRAIMLVLNSVNRLSSTVFLTGGITPIVAAGLIGTISWSHWLVLMCVPYAALLALASLAIYLRYRHGFRDEVAVPPAADRRPLTAVELRTALITAGAGLLWLTDSLHHWHPTLPALLAWIGYLLPRWGVLTWREFEREFDHRLGIGPRHQRRGCELQRQSPEFLLADNARHRLARQATAREAFEACGFVLRQLALRCRDHAGEVEAERVACEYPRVKFGGINRSGFELQGQRASRHLDGLCRRHAAAPWAASCAA